MSDLISRKKVKYKLTALVNEFEEILSHIREDNVDDSVCGLCEYDGAYIGQSGDWCNECPGFEKDDCFKLKDKYRKEWEAIADLPSAQPERLTDDDFETIRIHLDACKEKLCNQQRWKEAEEYQHIIDRFMAFASAQPETKERTEKSAQYVPNNDLISRKAAIDGKISIQRADGVEIYSDEAVPVEYLKRLPSVQPESKQGQWWLKIIDRENTLSQMLASSDEALTELHKVTGMPTWDLIRKFKDGWTLQPPSAQPEQRRGKWMKKEDFDKRICDVESNASNEETYREFLVNSIHHFYGDDAMIPDFDKMSEEELNDRIDEMDMLWEK